MVLTNECAVSRCGNFQMDSVMTTQTSFSYNVVVHGMSLEQCCEKIAKNLKNKCVMHKCIIIVSYIDETMVIAAGLPPLIHQSSSLIKVGHENKIKIKKNLKKSPPQSRPKYLFQFKRETLEFSLKKVYNTGLY